MRAANFRIPPDPKPVRDIPEDEARAILLRAAQKELRFREARRPYQDRTTRRSVVVDLGNGKTAAVIFMTGYVAEPLSWKVLHAEEVRV